MHRANLTAATRWLSDERTNLGPAGPANFAHAFWADWNAGEEGLMPELDGI
jgi:hypothetical protein